MLFANRSIDASNHNTISSSGDSGVVIRGRNFGQTAAPDKMKVRVFIGTDFNTRDESVGFKVSHTSVGGTSITSSLQASPAASMIGIDIYNVNTTGLWNIDSLKGASMKECYTIFTPDGSTEKQYRNARWYPSYNYTLKGARNVDGQPYISCTPAKDVSGPKNVTIIVGDQIDSCATNYRLCADPISYR